LRTHNGHRAGVQGGETRLVPDCRFAAYLQVHHVIIGQQGFEFDFHCLRGVRNHTHRAGIDLQVNRQDMRTRLQTGQINHCPQNILLIGQFQPHGLRCAESHLDGANLITHQHKPRILSNQLNFNRLGKYILPGWIVGCYGKHPDSNRQNKGSDEGGQYLNQSPE